MAKKSATPKKEIRSKIASKLQETFADLEKKVGKNSFRKNIKKASKALVRNLKETAPARPARQKKNLQAADSPIK